MYKEIQKCRICGNSNLVKIMDLGTMALTGIYPLPDEKVEEGPLELIKCDGDNVCGLVQLKHSFEAEKMYGGGVWISFRAESFHDGAFAGNYK